MFSAFAVVCAELVCFDCADGLFEDLQPDVPANIVLTRDMSRTGEAIHGVAIEQIAGADKRTACW